MAHCPYSSIIRQEAAWLRFVAGLSKQREQEWRAEVRQAAQHAQAQATAAVEALSPAHRLDPADIAWGERKDCCSTRACRRVVALGPILRTAPGERPCSGGFAVLSAVEQRVHFHS